MNEILQGIKGAALDAVTINESGSFTQHYRFDDRFVGFDGHFPNAPILPAIVQIMTVISLAGEESGCRQRLVSVEDAKFLVPIRPDQELLVECCRKIVRGKTLHDAKMSVARNTAARFLLELVSEEEQ